MKTESKKVKYNETEGVISFICPGCKDRHIIPVKGANAWQWNRSEESPTLSPSILVQTGHYVPGQEGKSCWCSYNAANPDEPAPFVCYLCHSYLRDGSLQFLGDCSHDLAGQIVKLPDLVEPFDNE